jgi:hypothetical protein
MVPGTNSDSLASITPSDWQPPAEQLVIVTTGSLVSLLISRQVVTGDLARSNPRLWSDDGHSCGIGLGKSYGPSGNIASD